MFDCAIVRYAMCYRSIDPSCQLSGIRSANTCKQASTPGMGAGGQGRGEGSQDRWGADLEEVA